VATALAGLASAAGCAGNGAAAPDAAPAAVDEYAAGVLAQRAGDEELAIELLESAVERNPELRMAHALLGDIYRESGLYGDALPHYESVVRLDPTSAENYRDLGVTYQMLNRLRDAADTYVAGLAIEQDDLQLNLALGQVYLALRDLDRGLRFLEQATRIDPDNPSAWSSLGVAHDMRGNPVLAEASYQQALELDGASPSIKQNLAANQISQGKVGAAVGLLEDVVGEAPSPLAYRLLGDARRQQEEFGPAVDEYEAALGLDRNYVPALNGMGQAFIGLYQEGLELEEIHRTAAVAAWRRSLTIRPTQPEVEALLARWGD
jgi:tetratricopeptide (TPR) repeat protein